MPTLELDHRALGFRPGSIDEKARTVELTASTGAGRWMDDMDGRFLEVLEVKPGSVDLSRVDGMPLLDSHRQDGLDRVLGVVRGARIENSELIVSVQISERAEAIWKDIKAGIIRNVSVGYSVNETEDRADPETGHRVRAVVGWTLMEVSLVPVAADAGAKTRGSAMPDNPNPAPAPAPAQPPTPSPIETRAAVNQEIRDLARTFDLGAAFADPLIDRQASADEARTAAIEEVRKRGNQPAPVPRVTSVIHHDAPEQLVSRMGEALYARSNPAHQVSEPARAYMNVTTLDMARDCLQRAGVQTTGLSPADTIRRALQTTSDYPLIFADTANRSLRAGYENAPAVMKRLARQTTAKDFRSKTKIQIGEMPTLEKVNEAGEYKYGSQAEAAESYSIDTFGKIIALSRKALVNDDLGAFNDLSGKLGMAAAEFENQTLIDLLESGSGNGPTMSDTKALFHADHGNKAGSGAAPDETTLSAARLAMRKQTGLSGRRINVQPKFLLVPPDLETTAEKLLATIQAAKADDVNPFGGKFELLVDARLADAARWFMAADPNQVAGLEFAYLQGEEGPQIETRAGFEVDGMEVKVRLDFGAAFLDWRGWYMNDGN